MVHPFYLGNPEVALATEAAWCAADQGKFFEYQHALYENQGMPLNPETLTRLASQPGLDSQRLARCLAARTHQADVENARQQAIQYGITSTPTFLINGRRVEGNQPYELFQRVIEQELAAVR